jgi:phage/plasmid-like protein (TIGR03299 family)
MADYFEKGFCVRTPSWHQKEDVLRDYPGSWAEALPLAGLDWEPELRRLYRKTTKLVPAPAFSGFGPDNETLLSYEGAVYHEGQWCDKLDVYVEAAAQEVVRNDTGAVLGNVSDKFELLLNRQMGPIIETILGQTNVKFDTARSLKGGRLVYCVVLLDEPVRIKGDNSLTLTYLVILNSHDGSGACKVLFTTVRVVCANTFGTADRQGDSHGLQFSFRHTTGMADRIAQAKDALQGARSATADWVATAELLALQPFSRQDEQSFVERFLAMPPVGSATLRVQQNVEAARVKLYDLFERETNYLQRGTAISAVNAAVEYLDHVRPYRTKDSYMGRQLINPTTEKARALKIVKELVSV